MPDDYVSTPDPPQGGSPVLFRPSTFDRHSLAIEIVEGENRSLYPRSPRGRTTHPALGAWGYLAPGATISGASGLSLGSGTVRLCSRNGGSLTADGEDVQVLNSGSSITGPKALSLEWTDGAFAVCLCGLEADCLFCRPCQIPTKNLAFSYTGVAPLSPTSGSGSLTFDGMREWSSDPFGGGFVIDLQCIGRIVTPNIFFEGVSQATFGNPSWVTTCNPLNLVYNVPDPSAAYTAGFRTLTISDPGPPTSCGTPCDCTNCAACDGVTIDYNRVKAGEATVSDDHGTHVFDFLSTGFGICTDILTATGLPVLHFHEACDEGFGTRSTCFIETGDVPYYICFNCIDSDGTVQITMGTQAIENCQECGIPPVKCGYSEYAGGGWITKKVTPTCDGNTLVATADFSFNLDCYGNSVSSVINSATVSIPIAPADSMCQSFLIESCFNVGIEGVSFSVYDHEGGTLLYSGVSGARGETTIVYFRNTGFTYWVTADSPDSRLLSFAGTKSMTCNGGTTIQLQPAEGYVCVTGCEIPLEKIANLYATHPVFGPLTLEYDPAGSLGDGWYATVTYSYPGCQCCPARTVTVTCYLNRSLQFSDHWKSN